MREDSIAFPEDFAGPITDYIESVCLGSSRSVDHDNEELQVEETGSENIQSSACQANQDWRSDFDYDCSNHLDYYTQYLTEVGISVKSDLCNNLGDYQFIYDYLLGEGVHKDGVWFDECCGRDHGIPDCR